MSSTILSDAGLLLLLLSAGACASSRGSQSLPSSPHNGPPRAVLIVPKQITRGVAATAKLGILGSPRYESLRGPVAITLSVIDDAGYDQEVAWLNPMIGRLFTWELPAMYTSTFVGAYVTIHVELSSLAGYTYTGKPILTKPFTRVARRIPVRYPVAGGNFGPTPNSALRYRDHGCEGLHVVELQD